MIRTLIAVENWYVVTIIVREIFHQLEATGLPLLTAANSDKNGLK